VAKTGLVSPLLWQVLPFKDEDAWLDFLGAHERWHQVLAEKTGSGGGSWQIFGDLKVEGSDAHQRVHDGLADAIDIPRPGDLTSFDLQKEDAFVQWTFVHALEHQRLRLTLAI
jgi:hypothetical protein